MNGKPVLATLDFEASSLGEDGYPIEVACVIGTGPEPSLQFSSLIKPRREWKGGKGWSEASAAIHGIAREELEDGMDADGICLVLDRMLSGLTVVVDGGSYDRFWLEPLYGSRAPLFEPDDLSGIDVGWFAERKRSSRVAHRALPDALWLYRTVVGYGQHSWGPSRP